MSRSSRLAQALMVFTVIASSCSGGGGDEAAPEVTVPIATELRPTPDGYSFPNFGASAVPEVFEDADLAAMFGAEACVDGVTSPCVATAEAAAWARMVNQSRLAGHCEGLAVEAAVRFDGRMTPPTFELANQGDVTRQILRGFATQFLPEVQEERDQWATRSLREIVNELGRGFSTGTNDFVLGLYTPRGGHAVLPYAVDFEGEDVAVVRVYDSNWPGRNRYVRMDLTADTWSFSFAAEDPAQDPSPWTGIAGDVDLASMETRTQSKCPFCGDGGDSLNSVLVIRADDDAWSVSTSDGEYGALSESSDLVEVRPILNGLILADDESPPEDGVVIAVANDWAELRRFMQISGLDFAEMLRFERLALASITNTTTGSAPKDLGATAASSTRRKPVRDFLVIVREAQFTLTLSAAASAFVVQPNAIAQVVNPSGEAVVVVGADTITTESTAATTTVAAADVAVAVTGAVSEVQVGVEQITASLTTESGRQASVVATPEIPQVVLAAPVARPEAEIVISTQSRSGQVQVTEVSQSGNSTTKTTDVALNLNSAQVALPTVLTEVVAKQQLPPAEERDARNPEYVIDSEFVSAQTQVVEREPVLAAVLTTDAPTTTAESTTTTAVAQTT
ncbi:MAG: hypothetical protein EBV42_02295, partial [Actinobacteria bacterium]|nr:hypothetical protein [Actinomycetota bacterium]